MWWWAALLPAVVAVQTQARGQTCADFFKNHAQPNPCDLYGARARPLDLACAGAECKFEECCDKPMTDFYSEMIQPQPGAAPPFQKMLATSGDMTVARAAQAQPSAIYYPAGAIVPDAGLGCISWRAVSGPDPLAVSRNPVLDQPCDAPIISSSVGFCECEYKVVTSAIGPNHTPFTCRDKCRQLKGIHREMYISPTYPPNWPAQTSVDVMNAVKDPYAQAQFMGEKAITSVNAAVDASRRAVEAAKGMMSKMINLEPWKEMDQAGQLAELAGRKVREAARVARPFIYTQKSETKQ